MDDRSAAAPRLIVVTGGPGAGKTAVLEMVRRSFCSHVGVLPEAASIVFGGGFPRLPASPWRQGAQRAIYHVQRALEDASTAAGGAAVVLCDRGTIDGQAYWVPPGSLWDVVGTTRERELARYSAVFHLRTPRPEHGYNQKNSLRVETAAEAAAIDDRIAAAWADHPRRFFVESRPEFLDKVRATLELIRAELRCGCPVGARTAA
jgi:predicted ATPase